MKTGVKILSITIIIIIFLYIYGNIFIIDTSCRIPPKLEVGQKWIYISEDPFHKSNGIVTIIDIKGGYVQYTNGRDTASLPVRIFLVGEKRVK